MSLHSFFRNLFLLGEIGHNEIIVFLFLIVLIIAIVAAVSKSRTKSPPNTSFTSAYDSNTVPISQTVVVVNEGKSVGLAFLLAFFLGPLGLLYASVSGGIIMIVLSIFVGAATLGAGLVVMWIISIIWAVIAAGNSKQNSTTVVTHPPPAYQQPPVVDTKSAATSGNKENLLNQLSQLHALKEKGVLTDEIYERERQHILNKLSS